MKIDKNILSIPPHIITAWDNVVALTNENGQLVVVLGDGSRIPVPDLSEDQKQEVFDIYEEILTESESDTSLSNQQSAAEVGPDLSSPLFSGIPGMDKLGELDGPLRFAFGPGVGGFQSAMQHDSSQMNAPDLPAELLDKVGAIAKIVAPADLEELPEPEPHCNCVHCQLMRAIHGKTKEELDSEAIESIDDEVSDEDLKFKSWDIEQSGDKLYIVTNPLDKAEQYTVFLGDEIGCTCGQKTCEHVKSVLLS